MLMDPLLIFFKCFATWLRIRILMAFAIIWCIILMSLSAWLSISQGGSFGSYTFASGNSYSNWNSVCSQSPYTYLSPFSFSYSIPGNATHAGSSSSSNSMCAYPVANSEFRIVLSVISIVMLGILYVKTPLSLIARILLIVFAMMYFAVFVMDASAAVTGKTFCTTSFSNTLLNKDIEASKMSISCDTTQYEVVVVVDLMISATLFIIHGAWALTKDLYIQKKGTPEAKTLLKKGKSSSAV
jgi:hypothetical protein